MQELYQEDYEELSLKLLAVQMYGEELKGLDCNDCTVKDKNNCEMSINYGQVYYHEDLEVDINTCPLNCILSGHYVFWDKYYYYTETGATMPQYEQCDALFWKQYKSFTRYKNIVLNNK